jgi:hypothetical protein
MSIVQRLLAFGDATKGKSNNPIHFGLHIILFQRHVFCLQFLNITHKEKSHEI